MLRDWLLTVGVRQNQKKHMLSKTLPGYVRGDGYQVIWGKLH